MKDIAELDRNMAVANRIDDPEIVWRDARTAPIALEGLYQPLSGGPFRRLPREVAEATSEGVAQLALHTAGGRARFATDSPLSWSATAVPQYPPRVSTMPVS